MATPLHRSVVLLTVLGLVLLLGAAAVAPTPAFDVQPDGQSSYILDSVGDPIYDMELANMLSMWVVDAGFANMLCVFIHCHSGGMLDDLVTSLAAKGDVALMAATEHDGKAHCLWGSFTPFDETLAVGIDRPVTFFGHALADQLVQTGSSAPTASQMLAAATENDLARTGVTWDDFEVVAPGSEMPQGFFLGAGGDVRIGSKTDGTKADSVHAILFLGDAEVANWNDLDRAYHALRHNHNVPWQNITVLAGFGPGFKRYDGTFPPSYVTGRGSRRALFDAIRALKPVMNDGEQLILWMGGHGNREQTSEALKFAVTLSAQVTVPPGPAATHTDVQTWQLGPEFLLDAQSAWTSGPFVRLLVEPDFDLDLADQLKLLLNGVELPAGSRRELSALDDDPDLDGYEFMFVIDDVELLRETNRVQVDWVDPTLFQPYTIFGLGFGAGDRPPQYAAEPEVGDTSSHLLVLPTLFHPEELHYVSKRFLDGGCEVFVATPNGAAGARAALGELAFDVAFLPLADVADGYDGVHFLGYGWYVEWYLPLSWGIPVPEFTRDATALIEHALTTGTPLGAIGSGVWALILSELLAGIELSVYDCPDLLDACLPYGITTIIANGESAPGAPSFPRSRVHLYWADGTPVYSLSTPAAQYGPEEGDAFVETWGPDMEEYVHTVCE